MPTRYEAEDHLRVIRSLMEKATIYRAISAPGAAVGAALACGASFAFGNPWSPDAETLQASRISATAFMSVWMAVLALTASVNLLFLFLDARKRGDRFASSGMKLALRALAPSYLVAAFFTILAGSGYRPHLVVLAWIFCHGLGLLATSHFAPRSLMWLGWAFLIAGCVFFLDLEAADRVTLNPHLASFEAWQNLRSNSAIIASQKVMALTFGFFHLIYAACTWPRKRAESDAGAMP